MADVRPFGCCRPVPELAAEVAALPYDVFSRSEAAREIERHPHSFLRIDKSIACLPPETDEYAPEVYAAAAQAFARDLKRGVFFTDKPEANKTDADKASADRPESEKLDASASAPDKPDAGESALACFIYRLIQDGRAQTGLVACVSVDEYNHGQIKRHENTRAHKQRDRVEHIKALRAHTGPVFLAYRDQAAVDALVAAVVANQHPEYDFTAPDAVRHTVWRIAASEQLDALREAFSQVDTLYIADGHHRAAAAAVVAGELAAAAAAVPGENDASPAHSPDEPANLTTAPLPGHPLAEPANPSARSADHFLAILFPASQLQILDYNRVVATLNGLTPEQFLAQVAKHFTVELAVELAVDKTPASQPSTGSLADELPGAELPSAVSPLSSESSAPQPAALRSSAPQPAALRSSAPQPAVLRSSVPQPAAAKPYRPSQRGQFGMYLDGNWYKLTLDETSRPDDPVESLDVALLHSRLIAPILGISDPRQDSRISYVGGVRGLAELAERADAQQGLAFALYPCSLDELFAVADAGRLMPPKSTWFEPKPRSGLFIHRI